MIKILAIGNSFSRDALYYLNGIGAADGVPIKAVNLYIPGCSLEQHWNNIETDCSDYTYEENGYITQKKISVRKALESNEWDYIVTQQSSGKSGFIETFFPYLQLIAEYIQHYTHSAEFLLHQTWAFEKNYQNEIFAAYEYDQLTMYRMLSEAYRSAADRLNIRMIPCGDVVQKVRRMEPFLFNRGGQSLCRDGRHMDYIYGRYLLGAAWYRFLTGNPVSRNSFIPSTNQLPGRICDRNLLRIIQQTVDELC